MHLWPCTACTYAGKTKCGVVKHEVERHQLGVILDECKKKKQKREGRRDG